MKRCVYLVACVAVYLLTNAAYAQQTKSPEIVKIFRGIVAKPSQSTVRVLGDGKDAALGVVVGADGWILSKHSELKGKKIICKLADGNEADAELIAFDVPLDLAMLKVDAKGLTPVEWTDSKASRVGHWVASPGTGADPVAIGIISVASRDIKNAKFMAPSGAAGGYLGIQFDLDFAGVKVQDVVPNTPAQKAGLKKDDQILTLNGKGVDSADEFRALLSNTKAGVVVNLKVLREEKEMELKVTLGESPNSKKGKSRGEIQNSMGSKLSDRRAGFPVILQHDSVIKPTDCGGPLVNLDGKVLGINIARAGRTESYAIPSEAVRPMLEKLKMRK